MPTPCSRLPAGGCPARLGRSHATSLWPPPSPQGTRSSLPPPCPSQTQTKGPHGNLLLLTPSPHPQCHGCLNLNGEGNGLAMAPWHQDENLRSADSHTRMFCPLRTGLRNTREGQAFKSSHSVALSLRWRWSAEAYEATQPWFSSSCHSGRAGPGVRQTKVPSSTVSILRAEASQPSSATDSCDRQ